MNPDLKARLLASIDADRLVVVCGAGLSMSPPSNLPSAQRLVEMCFEKYQLIVGNNLDPAIGSSLEALAEYFVSQKMLTTVFIENIVPWSEFVRPSNLGHAAIADFLTVRAAVAGLSSNYDILIERCALDFGVDFRSSLDGDDANIHATTHGPLLKLHGCSNIDRSSTIWALSQLQDRVIKERVEKNKAWMAANLRQKDFLIVGFWSDWHYLNQIIGSALQDVKPHSVTVIDPSSPSELEQKAPCLWGLAHADNVVFNHVQESATQALDDLRCSFSKNYIRQILSAGKAAIEKETQSCCDPSWLEIADFDSNALYGWRRDAEGVPFGSPAKRKRPENNAVLGYFHLLLRKAGAHQKKYGYEMNGLKIRVINGASSFLSDLRAKFIEAPVLLTADLVVAVGATDIGLPINVVRSGREGDFIRPVPSGKWFDLPGARAALKI